MKFVSDTANQMGCHDRKTTDILWHYTRGESLVEMLRTGCLWSTHVSCLNDSSEYTYANKLFGEALIAIPDLPSDSDPISKFKRILRENALTYPNRMLEGRVRSSWYVASLSANEDDLSQWRAYTVPDNGYLIGFAAGELLNPPSHDWLNRVIYEEARVRQTARLVAEATIANYQEGLDADLDADPTLWMQHFLPAWGSCIDFLAVLAKHPKFALESEYRISASFRNRLEDIVVRQKPTILARHQKLKFSTFPLLPIKRIIVGPGLHQSSTRLGLEMLLQKCNYDQYAEIVGCSPIPAQAI